MRIRFAGLALSMAAAALTISLTSCSSTPTLAGTWTPSDGSGTKIINADGSCTGMYYNGTAPLDIGGPETCTLSSSTSNGAYTLVVQQSPNTMSYRATFSGNTLDLSTMTGIHIVTLTKQ